MKFRSMRSRRSGPAAPKRLVVALAFTLFSAAALAQEMGVPAGSAGRIAELTARAQRLTLLAELPEEARPEAEALLDRYDALRTAEQELEVARLEALVAALEAGDSPAVAREVAESAVADQKVELARQREQLRADVDDLADRFPEAANLFRRLASGRWVAGEGRIVIAGDAAMGFPLFPSAPDAVFRFDGPDGTPFRMGMDREAHERMLQLLPRLRQLR